MFKSQSEGENQDTEQRVMAGGDEEEKRAYTGESMRQQ